MKSEVGYWFALPRFLARASGQKVRRAEWSRWEAYGVGWLVFGIGCVFLGKVIFEFVRPGPGRILSLLLIPIAVWLGCLLVYLLDWLLAGLLRRLGLYRSDDNRMLQSFMIVSLTTVFAASLARQETLWLRSLGIFWLALVALNWLAAGLLKIG